MFKYFKKWLKNKDQSLTNYPIYCDHDYKYKAWAHDYEHFPYANSMFYKELIFRCTKCGHHKSIYTLDISREFDNNRRRDVEYGHENFRFELPFTIFEGNETYAIYKKYLEKGIDLTSVEREVYHRTVRSAVRIDTF